MNLQQNPASNKIENSNLGKTATETPDCDAYNWFYSAEKQRLIEVTAYLLAEQDGFNGDPLEYWCTAEANVGGINP